NKSTEGYGRASGRDPASAGQSLGSWHRPSCRGSGGLDGVTSVRQWHGEANQYISYYPDQPRIPLAFGAAGSQSEGSRPGTGVSPRRNRSRRTPSVARRSPGGAGSGSSGSRSGPAGN